MELEKILVLLATIKKHGKIAPTWILAKAKIYLICFNADKEAFLRTAETLTELKWYKHYIPMPHDKAFDDILNNLWSDIYDTTTAEIDPNLYSKQLSREMKLMDS